MASLVGPLVFPLGGDPPVVVPVPPPSLDPVGHEAVALTRLPQQFRNAHNEEFVAIFVRPFEAVEMALQQLLLERSVDTAVGAQLDVLGRLVGQAREGLGDDDYRRYIRARVIANKSDGTHEIIIKVIKLLLNSPTSNIESLSQRGTVAIRVNGVVVSDSLATILLSFARAVVKSAIRVFVESYPDTDENLFTCSQSFFLDTSVSPGGTLLVANTTYTDSTELEAFGTTGQLILDEGTPTEETVTYTARAGNQFTVTALTQAHASDSPASLTGSNALGKGWGDAGEGVHPILTDYTNLGTTGGRMADARGAE